MSTCVALHQGSSLPSEGNSNDPEALNRPQVLHSALQGIPLLPEASCHSLWQSQLLWQVHHCRVCLSSLLVVPFTIGNAVHYWCIPN